VEPYDPINFDAFFASDYGGYGGGSDGSGGGRRGGAGGSGGGRDGFASGARSSGAGGRGARTGGGKCTFTRVIEILRCVRINRAGKSNSRLHDFLHKNLDFYGV
jgi:hypothetical protein